MNWKKCPYMEKVFMIGGQFYTAVIGQFYAALDMGDMYCPLLVGISQVMQSS